MASKLLPSAPRAGHQLVSHLFKQQCRPFSAAPQMRSDVLAVVCPVFIQITRHRIAFGYDGVAVMRRQRLCFYISIEIIMLITLLIAYSTATSHTTTLPSSSSSTPRTSPLSMRSSSDTHPSTRRPPSCPCWTWASASTASPASAS